MIEHWHHLSKRDRMAAAIGGTCLVSYLFYLLIYSPLTTAVENKAKQLQEKKETLVWMQDALKNKPASHAKVQLTSNKLLSQLSNELKKTAFAKKFPYQIQQTSGGDVQLSFNQVPFNLLMTWLKETNERYAVIIKHLMTSSTEVPGIVKLTVIIAPH